MTAHTLRRGLVHDDHRPATEPFGGPMALAFTACLLASVPLAYLSTLAAQLLWVATLGLRYPVRRFGPRASLGYDWRVHTDGGQWLAEL